MESLTEVAQLLAKVTLNDNRKVDEGTLAFWHEALSGVSLNDALAALVTHHRDSKEWVTPAHLIALLRPVWAAQARWKRIQNQLEERELTSARVVAPMPRCPQHPEQGIASCRFCFAPKPRV